MSWGISDKACGTNVGIPWQVSAYAMPLQRVKTLGMTQNRFVYVFYICTWFEEVNIIIIIIIIIITIAGDHCHSFTPTWQLVNQQ